MLACIRDYFPSFSLYQNVKDVHQFPGHIACDAISNSEIVVPLVRDGDVVAVLDLDSTLLDCFDVEDQLTLEELSNYAAMKFDWSQLV